jgi:uncharacterized protein
LARQKNTKSTLTDSIIKPPALDQIKNTNFTVMGKIVQRKSELIKLILDHQDQIKQFGVYKLGVFGSFVRDTANEKSDIDFYIEFYPEKKNFDNFIDLAFYLQDLLGRKVELVTQQSLSKHIGSQILKEIEYVPFAA